MHPAFKSPVDTPSLNCTRSNNTYLALGSGTLKLKMEPDLSSQRSRRNIMGSAERGQKVIKDVVVSDIDGCQLHTDFVSVSMKQIIMPNR